MGWLLLLFSSAAFAGGPVFHDVGLPKLVDLSTTVILGWPSPHQSGKCRARAGVWQVHKVLMGDISLEGQLIPITNHKYAFQNQVRGKPPRYATERYRNAPLDFNSTTSLLFLNRRKDGCFELAAQGAQESPSAETLVRSLIEPTDCDLQLQAFTSLSAPLPRSCAVDDDCRPSYIHPNPCAPPLALNRTALAHLPKSWRFYMRRIRSACSKAWSQQAACERDDFRVRCRNKSCEFGLRETDSLEFRVAILRKGCAPHDGPSIEITLRGAKTYPILSLNWWGAGHPDSTSQFFRFVNQASGFSASLCLGQQQCEPLSDLLLERKGIVLDYLFHTRDGHEFRGSVSIEESSSMARCG